MTMPKPILYRLLLAFLLTLSVQANGAEFSDIYKAYNESLKSADVARRLELAKQALELGQAKFGENSQNAINLKYNLAKALAQNRQYRQAFDTMFDVTAGFDKKYGAQSEELFIALLDQLSFYRPKKGMKWKDKKQEITPLVSTTVELSKSLIDLNPENSPFVYYELSKVLNSPVLTPLVAEYSRHVAYLAYVELSKSVGPSNILTLEAQLYVANAMFTEQDFTNAKLAYEQIIERITGQFDKPHLVETQARKKLADLNDPDKLYVTPLVRIEPRYPAEYARKRQEGWVRMSFIIDKEGRPKNIKVTDKKGGRLFEKEAKRALEKWRYKPKVENGKPVEQVEQWVRLDFRLQK